MDKVTVGVAEGKVAEKNRALISYALGSCVGICLYDHREYIVGMAHTILLGRKYSVHRDNAYKFADGGVHELINQMREQGARPTGLVAKIAGGARMLDAPSGMLDIRRQNVVAVRECLAWKGVRLVAQHAGQDYGRTIPFYAENGRLEVSTIGHSAVVL